MVSSGCSVAASRSCRGRGCSYSTSRRSGSRPALVSTLFDAIVALAKRDGLGILLLEQNVGQALRIADRVAVMRSGRVILEESAAEMRARTSYWELF